MDWIKLLLSPVFVFYVASLCSASKIDSDFRSTVRSDLDIVGQVSTTMRKVFFTNSSEGAKMSWVDALEFCQQNQMALAEIDNAEENKVVTKFLSRFATLKFFWLGGTDYGSEGKFYWLKSGFQTEDVYSNWAPNFPQGGVKGNCIIINGENLAGTWYDYPCKFTNIRPLCQLQIRNNE